MQQKENRITDKDGNEYIQRRIDIGKPGREIRKKGRRVQVYNKLRARIHCSDCVLDAESEGSILADDLNHPNIRKNVIEVR